MLLWELKRTCLTRVLGCLPPSARVAFILTDILEWGIEDAAGVTVSAYRVRLARARGRVEDYLAPRCSHVSRRNPCDCATRLGIAIDGSPSL